MTPFSKVAIDVQVPAIAIPILQSHYFSVVVIARPGEPDAAWLDRARALGVNIVVSPDENVLQIAGSFDMEFVRIPQGLSQGPLAKKILDDCVRARNRMRNAR